MKRLLTVLLAIAGLLAESSICMAQKLEEFAFALPIEGTGGDAFYRVVIPQAVYEVPGYSDLRDLRIFNGKGEAVPFAFRPVEKLLQKTDPVPLRFFPMRGPRDARTEDLDLSVGQAGRKVNVRLRSSTDPNAPTVLLGYLIDASELTTPLAGLTFGWSAPGLDRLASVRVEASEDFKHWSTLVTDAPLGVVSHAGARLERNSLEFRSQRIRYLRLTWLDADRAIEFAVVRGVLPEQTGQPERMWKEVKAVADTDVGDTGVYLVDLGGRLPIDRLDFLLPQENTVVPLQIYARNGAGDKWILAASPQVYRVRQNGLETSSSPLVLQAGGDTRKVCGPLQASKYSSWIHNAVYACSSANRYWKIHAPKGSGGFGTGDLTVKGGWLPRELVFNARGDGPFRLAYGNASAEWSALPIEVLVPDFRTDRAPKIALATTGAAQTIVGEAATAPRIDARKWALWAALAAGVAVLGWMAWKLSSQMKKAERQ